MATKTSIFKNDNNNEYPQNGNINEYPQKKGNENEYTQKWQQK